jgi:hypothetical protein
MTMEQDGEERQSRRGRGKGGGQGVRLYESANFSSGYPVKTFSTPSGRTISTYPNTGLIASTEDVVRIPISWRETTEIFHEGTESGEADQSLDNLQAFYNNIYYRKLSEWQRQGRNVSDALLSADTTFATYTHQLIRAYVALRTYYGVLSCRGLNPTCSSLSALFEQRRPTADGLVRRLMTYHWPPEMLRQVDKFTGPFIIDQDGPVYMTDSTGGIIILGMVDYLASGVTSVEVLLDIATTNLVALGGLGADGRRIQRLMALFYPQIDFPVVSIKVGPEALRQHTYIFSSAAWKYDNVGTQHFIEPRWAAAEYVGIPMLVPDSFDDSAFFSLFRPNVCAADNDYPVATNASFVGFGTWFDEGLDGNGAARYHRGGTYSKFFQQTGVIGGMGPDSYNSEWSWSAPVDREQDLTSALSQKPGMVLVVPTEEMLLEGTELLLTRMFQL